MTVTEQYANNFATTLASAMTDVTTTALVVSAAPTALRGGQFRIAIGSEILLVTAGASTTTWTVSRGAEGTTPAAHVAGSTVSHVLTAASLLAATGYFDVVGYGAKGDGATDDRAAIQSAIAAAYAAQGGIVHFRAGDYLIGTPGLVIPASAQYGITLLGSGMGGTAADGVSAQPTRLVRNGAHALLTASGTGITGATVSHGLQVRDLTMDGAAYAADMVVLNRAAGGIFENVRLTNSGRTLVTSNQLWNYRFANCDFSSSGHAVTTTPAVYLTCPDATEQTATVMFEGCIFEGNAWDDVQLDGAGGRQALAVSFVGCHWERNVAGRCVYFKDAKDCSVIGGSMVQLFSNASPMVEQATGNFNSLIGVKMEDYEVGGSPTTADYAVRLVDGDYFTIVGCQFWGSKTAHIRLESGVGQVTIGPNMHNTAGATYTALPVSDARTMGEHGVIVPSAATLGTTGGNTSFIGALGGLAGTNRVSLGVRLVRVSNGSDWTTTAVRLSHDVDGVPYIGGYLSIEPDGRVYTGGKLTATGGIGVGNSAAATTPGSVVKKMQVFDAAGASLGYIPIYDAIT